MFGSTNSGSGFGSGFGAQSNNTTAGSSLFGNNNANQGRSLSFGGSANNNTNTPGGLFGNSATNNAGSTATGGLFGNSAAKTSNTGGLFGNSGANNTNSGATGGLFGNSGANNSTGATGGLFGNSNNTTNNTSSGGLFGSNQTAQTGGLFGNSGSATNNTTTGGLFGNNASTANTNGGLFGNKPATSGGATGGLFGNNNTTSGTTGGLFGNSNNASTGGLFGNTATATNGTTGSGLFSSSNTNSSTNGGLFGNNQQSQLFNNNQLNQANTPQKQYNFKDLPKSLTESTKKPTEKAELHRKLSSSSSHSSIAPTQRSALFEKLSNRMDSVKSQAYYNSEGLFSPKKDFIQSTLSNDKQDLTNASSSSSHTNEKQPLRLTFGSNIRQNPTQRANGSEFLKLKIDPARSEARRLKIFGPSNGAEKIRVLGNEEEELEEIEMNDEPKDESISEKTGVEDTDLKDATFNRDSITEEKDEVKTEDIVADDEEYWCSPTIEELSEMSLRELSEVHSFTIGRKGVGTISFNLPVDLSQFCADLKSYLFGGVVRINKNKTVEVYPDYQVPLGTGLNVPATITLEKCFPISKSKKHLNDPRAKDLEIRLFTKKLQSMKDMEFIAYDQFTGAWTFKVKHFSIWGLANEDDEVVDVDEELEKLKQEEEEQKLLQEKREKAMKSKKIKTTTATAKQQQPKMQHSKSSTSIEDSLIFKKLKMDNSFDMNSTSFMPGSFITEQDFEKVNETIGEEDEDDVDDGVANDLSDILPPRQNDLSFGEEDSAEEIDEPMDFEDDSEILNEKQYEPIDVDKEDFEIIDGEPSFPVADEWDEQLELASGLDSAFASTIDKKSKTIAVNDLFFDNDLIKQGKAEHELRLKNSKLNQPLKSSVQVPKKTYSADDIDTLKNIYENHVSISKISKRNNGFPKVEKNQNISFEFILKSFENVSFNKEKIEEKSLWELASALFDGISSNPELSAYNDVSLINKVVELKRYDGIVKWIKHEIEDEIKSKLSLTTDPLEQIFLHLVLFDIPTASKLAIKSKNGHLAVLISLLGSNDPSVKYSATRQVQEWKVNNILQTIPEGILKIYQLLKGEVLNVKDSIVEITQGLSWKAVLGMLLFYGNINEPLSSLLHDFIENNITKTTIHDIKFLNLLKLYVQKFSNSFKVDDILSSSVADNELDVRFNWYIYELLIRSTNAIPYNDFKSLGDKLTTSFAQELEANGLWEESLFVLSHLSDDKVASELILKALERNVKAFKDNNNLFKKLVDVLKVPDIAIYEANALYYHGEGDSIKEAESLLNAKKFDEAHKHILLTVAPKAVISNGESLEELESLILRFTNTSAVEDWSIGLGIYKNYIKLYKNGNINSVKYLINNLPLLKRDNFYIKVAATLMSKFVAEYLLGNSESVDEEVKNLDIELESISKLPLGESELQYFGRRLTLHFLKEKLLDQ